jgi:hypothetical protein
MSIDRSDHELRRLFQTRQRFVRVQTEIILERWRDVREHANVGARAKELLARARERDDLHRVVHARVENRAIELLHHLVAVGVRRRIVERDQCDPIADCIIEFVTHKRKCDVRFCA